MIQKNLIHIHPSISYIARCLYIVKTNSQNIIIHGGSIHKQDNKKFLKWLNKYIISNEFNKKLLIRNFKFGINLIFKIFNNIIFFRISKINRSYSKDIILDSICRRKSGYIYYKYPFLKKIIKVCFWIYFKVLTSYYKSIIDIVNPNNIIISHPVYIEYGSLLIAGTESNIKIIIISGAFHNSYFIKNKFKTYHYAMFLKHIYKKYNFHKKTHISGEAKNSIINDKKIKIIRPSKKCPADTLIISTHCFSDNNHISETDLMLFETYYEWFKETCKLLNEVKEPTYKNYVIKIHPHIKVFREEDLFHQTIRKYIKNKKLNLIICNDNKSISEVLNQKTISLINITVHGQICAELGSIGVPSIACGMAQGPIEAQFNPKNIEQYKKIIFDNKYASDCLSKNPFSKIIREESRKYQMFSKYLFPDKSLREKLYLIRDYYNFKKSKPADENVLEILLELKNYNKLKQLILNNGWGVFLNNE